MVMWRFSFSVSLDSFTAKGCSGDFMVIGLMVEIIRPCSGLQRRHLAYLDPASPLLGCLG